MIEEWQLAERYGDKRAVDGADFVLKPGTVTGFLRPEGAGNSLLGTGRYGGCTASRPAIV
ncbi:hypothetical protein Srufu_007920 [Streptomyces libani subsp. rufus]|nr:hypothetical protein Srufu_007920 [Streptomyces libani subsp. rufus]